VPRAQGQFLTCPRRNEQVEGQGAALLRVVQRGRGHSPDVAPAMNPQHPGPQQRTPRPGDGSALTSTRAAPQGYPSGLQHATPMPPSLVSSSLLWYSLVYSDSVWPGLVPGVLWVAWRKYARVGGHVFVGAGSPDMVQSSLL